jgi:uncharacterized protein YaiE (UPF0345 family)
MASSYDNDLRLNEMATGDGSGTWGTTTNVNLNLIAEAFSYGTEAITTNADTHTTTIADGATDPGRSMYLKYTGTLDSACTITIAPNDISKVWIIENGTSGSQNIIISQGSGANITIPAGDTKVVYSDGAGAGAAFFDAFASLSVVDLKVQDDLTVTDDLIVNGDIDLEGSIDVNGTANLDIVDIDGAVNMATTALVTGVLTTTATQVATGGITSGSDIISDTDSTDSLGSTGVRWLKGWFDSLTAGTLTVGSGSVTDSSGAISFGDENLTTTGIVTAAGTSVFTNLDISGDIDVDGTTNLDVVDIDGAVQIDATLSVGVNDTGYDVKLFGATSGKYMLWDESADLLIVSGAVESTTNFNSTSGNDLRLNAGSVNRDIFMQVNGTTYMTVQGSTGNVGIGTTSPTFSAGGGLNVAQATFATIRARGGASTGVDFAQASDGKGYVYVRDNADLIFGTNNAERLRILSGGEVGINTSSVDSGLNLQIGSNDGNVAAMSLRHTSVPAYWANGFDGSQSISSMSLNSQMTSNGSDTYTATRQNDNYPIVAWEVGTSNIRARYGTGATLVTKFTIATSTGNTTIAGSLSKGSGSFKIDHPLPAKTDTHHLIHSFIEGPQADNIYRGKVDLVNGSATINIDTVAGMTEGTFVALNREVQCFTTNESNWDAVKGSVSGNILTIESENSESTATISWLVIGERKDQHMYDTDWTDDDGKVIVEPLKTDEE